MGNPKNSSNRYFSYFCITICMGVLTVLLEDYLIPYFYSTSSHLKTLYKFSLFLDGLLTSIFHYAVPYILLLMALSYTHWFTHAKQKMKRRIHFVIFSPVLLMYIIFNPFTIYFNPDKNPYFHWIAIWAIPYILISIGFMFHSLIKEKVFNLRLEKFLTLIITLPASLFILLTCYVLIVFDIRGGYRYYLPLVVLEFLIFIMIAVKYGIFGVRLKLESFRFNSTLKAVTTGTSFLNHAFKNELSKISLCTNILFEETHSDFDDYKKNVYETTKIISRSTEHLMGMVNRIQQQINNIEIEPTTINLPQLVTECLEEFSLKLTRKHTQIKANLPDEILVCCDRLQMKEVIDNLINNSIEAMEANGSLHIEVTLIKQYAVLSIQDNGQGIPKETLPYIFDPFFTTKKKKGNYGLGLTYCYNVVQKHGGQLEIESQLHIGTQVTVKLPLSLHLRPRKRFVFFDM
ncbi:MAG: HAMP domain-containing histidine kinase [Clostridia bacterium]|nr:HAMP domain-containing histidine kinase [Clostridia bacterium]